MRSWAPEPAWLRQGAQARDPGPRGAFSTRPLCDTCAALLVSAHLPGNSRCGAETPVPVAAGHEPSPETRAGLEAAPPLQKLPRRYPAVDEQLRPAKAVRAVVLTWTLMDSDDPVACVSAVSTVGPLLGNEVAGIGGGERIWLVRFCFCDFRRLTLCLLPP